MLKIKDLKTLMKLKTNNKIDELALVEETRTLYKWDGENWNIYKNPTGVNVSLYGLNQGAMTAAPAMPTDAIEAAKQTISDYVDDFPHAHYFMLLSNERGYYTLFSIGHATGTDFEYPAIEDEVIECIKSRGVIKDISKVDNGVDSGIEFWITEDNNSYVYYLFNYDEGVIKCQ